MWIGEYYIERDPGWTHLRPGLFKPILTGERWRRIAVSLEQPSSLPYHLGSPIIIFFFDFAKQKINLDFSAVQKPPQKTLWKVIEIIKTMLWNPTSGILKASKLQIWEMYA